MPFQWKFALKKKNFFGWNVGLLIKFFNSTGFSISKGCKSVFLEGVHLYYSSTRYPYLLLRRHSTDA